MADTKTPTLAVVTGASSGIGRATALALAKQGRPLLLARRADRLAEVQAEIGAEVCEVASVDVTDREAVATAVEAAVAKHGPVDVLVNNAGVMKLGKVASQDPAEWKLMLDVNLMGLFNVTHTVLPSMVERNGGTIVNISSIAGFKTFANHAAYCATKFGVHGFTETLREEVSGKNVRISLVSPGAVSTELLSHTTDEEIKAGYEAWKEDIGGAIEAVNVADCIAMIVSQPQNVCIREISLAATKQAP
ncbi:short-chain dehydrogenase/reductase family Oxidoreductase [Thecamonas trahens ATCC 50062]|uniref:Short-chain dehydrogenase/reductase family Oxidoreductase n=1 Tax=Thecamonas trahens ATCC 50062 TaxID=461836 RepID=A0A0L0DE65_THETB|nr:short-chain dehydrogenase/reductase family Oxidoreductase [Thecamonas trahens ATCC 50062]KNC50520.1 short-chain dehydrogenase/reductase family Oxidoreductase [Thecamonas trahens ATCC 50062]|eukprot:XP_013762412.1 short-chain dehydrogenase/reductase family Oxidoreductase [Thecamonas trahens ATCC 50062]